MNAMMLINTIKTKIYIFFIVYKNVEAEILLKGSAQVEQTRKFSFQTDPKHKSEILRNLRNIFKLKWLDS